jgi:predicted ATP-grasp superfamily ATP-dependent carboligase
MIINNLKTLKQFFQQIKTPIFGVGVYAFDRLGLEEIVSQYRILALRYSLDTKLIEKDIQILSLEKGMGTKHIREPRNATTIIARSQKVKKYLNKFKNPALIVYKASNKMEQACQENGWRLIANPTHFGKKLFEDKIKFRRILQELGLPIPPGKVTSVNKLHYGHLINKYGLPFVIQHPTKGGGKGTFFINNQEDFDKALKKLGQRQDEEDMARLKPPTKVIVAQFIQGSSPSITVCVTKHGILSTNPQYQILDIPQLYNPEKGSGLFCGHDWTSSRFSSSICQQAYQFVEKVGQYFKNLGYRGIFGIDFILDENNEQLYAAECNPRLVGAYPTLNMAQLLNNEPLILAFHVLEFLNIDYQINLEEINRLMRQEKIGSQMIMHNLTGRWARNYHQLKAGVYKLKNNKLKYLRPGYDLKHLKNKEEFLLADGVPFKKSHFSPNRRLCRVLTLNQTLNSSTYKELSPWAQQVAETVYQSFKIKPIKWIKLKKIFSPHFLAKG